MLRRYTFSFYDVMGRLQDKLAEAKLFDAAAISLDSGKVKELYRILTEVENECASMHLDHATSLVSFIAAKYKAQPEDDFTRTKIKYRDIAADLDIIWFTFGDELRKELFFRIPRDTEKYFEKDDLLGAVASAAFPSCVTEMRDAGTCFSLEKYEACVFHLMRILERSLGALAGKFKVDFQHTNWHNVIEQVESRVRKMDSSFGPDWKDQQQFYSEAASQFMFFKDAWRNHVMHVRGVPYDAGRALSVLSHVREFMQAVAKGGLAE
jgi:hypothetical protein